MLVQLTAEETRRMVTLENWDVIQWQIHYYNFLFSYCRLFPFLYSMSWHRIVLYDIRVPYLKAQKLLLYQKLHSAHGTSKMPPHNYSPFCCWVLPCPHTLFIACGLGSLPQAVCSSSLRTDTKTEQRTYISSRSSCWFCSSTCNGKIRAWKQDRCLWIFNFCDRFS